MVASPAPLGTLLVGPRVQGMGQDSHSSHQATVLYEFWGHTYFTQYSARQPAGHPNHRFTWSVPSRFEIKYPRAKVFFEASLRSFPIWEESCQTPTIRARSCLPETRQRPQTQPSLTMAYQIPGGAAKHGWGLLHFRDFSKIDIKVTLPNHHL